MPLFLAPKIILISTPFQRFMRSVLTYRIMAQYIFIRTILSIDLVKQKYNTSM